MATPTKSVTKTSTSSTKTIVATKSSESSIKEEDKNEDSSTNTKFINPIPGAILTQGIHDGNAVDFGAPIGTSVYATAEGTVLIAKSGGYNSGYGSYIVINHEGGAQTLYGHLSSVSVSPGDTVKQGDLIAKSGNTGRSTGPHLHYKEIGTGARNTFGNYKKGTQF